MAYLSVCEWPSKTLYISNQCDVSMSKCGFRGLSSLLRKKQCSYKCIQLNVFSFFKYIYCISFKHWHNAWFYFQMPMKVKLTKLLNLVWYTTRLCITWKNLHTILLSDSVCITIANRKKHLPPDIKQDASSILAFYQSLPQCVFIFLLRQPDAVMGKVCGLVTDNRHM